MKWGTDRFGYIIARGSNTKHDRDWFNMQPHQSSCSLAINRENVFQESCSKLFSSSSWLWWLYSIKYFQKFNFQRAIANSPSLILHQIFLLQYNYIYPCMYMYAICCVLHRHVVCKCKLSIEFHRNFFWMVFAACSLDSQSTVYQQPWELGMQTKIGCLTWSLWCIHTCAITACKITHKCMLLLKAHC
jgi:hypothetical protein